MGKTSSFFGRHWKVVLNVVTFAALVVLVVASWDQIVQTFDNLFKVHAWWLLAIIPIEFLNYDAQARLYQGLFKITGNKLGYKQLFKASLELNFVNHVFPSGGVTGISYFGLRMRGAQLTGTKATLVQIMKLALLFLSFEVLIVIGLLFLAVDGHINNAIILLAGILTTLLLVGTVGFMFIVGSKQRIASFFTWGTVQLNRVIRLVRPGRADTIHVERAREIVDDLHANYMLVRQDWRQLKRPFVWAFAANFWEVMAVYVVYVAFGDLVNFGAVILAYAVANFAGLISIAPGGVGIYEGLMTLVLATAGIPANLSLPVTVMYRILNTVVQLPPGYWLYHKALHGKKPDELTAGSQEPGGGAGPGGDGMSGG